MKRLAALLLVVLAAGCASFVPPPAAPAVALTPAQAVERYARVLEGFVDSRGAVDFERLARQPEDLHAYVAFIAATPATAFAAGDARLAHYINSYNALSMYNVVVSGIPASHAGWRKVSFFYLTRFQVGGERLSLYAYENDVIRLLGDPRIHFALNCSAVSCPVLPRRPFAAADLQATLDRETRSFFASGANLRVDRAAAVVHLNEILRFYREDFGTNDAALLAFVSRYAPEPIPPHFTVRFIPYDWTVANARR